MQISKIKILAATLGLVCMSVSAQDLAQKPFIQSNISASMESDSSAVMKRIISFKQLGYNGSITLQGSESNVYIGFGSRLDEVVSKAVLHFNVTPSPALLSLVSHIKVYFNNELIGVVPITEGEQGKQLDLSIPLDPRYFSNYNQLRFELIGNIKTECSDPNDPSIWAEIGQNSSIEMYVQNTAIKSDLSLFPAPFFDYRDFSQLNLPLVMGSHPNTGEIKAAGVLSSYFGSLAGWRGAKFPLSYDALPDHNAIIFITNDNKPKFFHDFPDVDGPKVQVITHPMDPYVKLLLVMGRNSQELNKAVQGVVLGNTLLTGSIAKIDHVKQLKPRVPYDAPNWISTKGPVRFSDLIKQPSQLQVEGRTPPAITLNAQLPPDLFTWDSRGIPMNLHYRYSPPTIEHSGSRLTLSVNDQFVQAFNLAPKGQGSESDHVRIPLIDDSSFTDSDFVHIPAFKVGSKNQIRFNFSFASITAGRCVVTQPSKQYAVIDGNSTIDFSGFPHYIEMPNTHVFASSGFPFTRMADLSQTVAILPKHASRETVQTFLNVMGTLGRNSGYPGINVTVTKTWTAEQLKDKDILSIGVVPELNNIEDDSDLVNLVLKASERQIRLPRKNEPVSEHDGISSYNTDQDASDVVSVNAMGNFAAITGMESPFTRGRSVIAILASQPSALASVDNALNDSGKIEHTFGTVVTLRDNEVASYNVGDHYYVGQLPLWKLVWYHFSNHPILVAILAAFLVVIIAIVLWRVLRKLSAVRLEKDNEDHN
ncbi:TPA: cellulose biosynthesis cyclic di-GMP-binding regulatory protein BcsB [Photobacterium damselae]|uniref:cellulose biosynthesis cyclic di-GMP-binding regulatory protein BcsB n=1 Tax=Photobacterium damselae TaxID=38293 RepID=UPI00370C4D92